MVKDAGTQNLNPDEEGKGTEDKTQAKAQDLVFGRFKTIEDAEKGYGELHSDYGRVVEKLRKLEEKQETDLESIVGSRDSEIEELKKQLKQLQTPATSGRYNPEYVRKIEEMVGLPEGRGSEYLDIHRGLAAYDRQMEEKERTNLANKKEMKRQWAKVREDYGMDTLKEIAPEIDVVLDEFPVLKDYAYENPNAMRRVVQLAEKLHEETVEAQKAEEKLRDMEKEESQSGGAPGGTVETSEDDKLSLKQLEEKYGWNPDGGPIPE